MVTVGFSTQEEIMHLIGTFSVVDEYKFVVLVSISVSRTVCVQLLVRSTFC